MEDPWLDVPSPPPHPAGSCGSVRLSSSAALPLTLAGQAPAQRSAATGSRWADDIIKQEGYAVPPKELAEAVLAPRHQNVGTDPTNSLRLYHALNGLGKTTALYLYPLEDHGPAAKETLLDLWARWAAWLDKYVKNPQPTEGEKRKITTSSENR
jgi:hypothetical protein